MGRPPVSVGGFQTRLAELDVTSVAFRFSGAPGLSIEETKFNISMLTSKKLLSVKNLNHHCRIANTHCMVI